MGNLHALLCLLDVKNQNNAFSKDIFQYFNVFLKGVT